MGSLADANREEVRRGIRNEKQSVVRVYALILAQFLRSRRVRDDLTITKRNPSTGEPLKGFGGHGCPRNYRDRCHRASLPFSLRVLCATSTNPD